MFTIMLLILKIPDLRSIGFANPRGRGSKCSECYHYLIIECCVDFRLLWVGRSECSELTFIEVSGDVLELLYGFTHKCIIVQ